MKYKHKHYISSRPCAASQGKQKDNDMNDKLEKAKQIIDQYYDRANCGIYDCNGWGGEDKGIIHKANYNN